MLKLPLLYELNQPASIKDREKITESKTIFQTLIYTDSEGCVQILQQDVELLNTDM